MICSIYINKKQSFVNSTICKWCNNKTHNIKVVKFVIIVYQLYK